MNEITLLKICQNLAKTKKYNAGIVEIAEILLKNLDLLKACWKARIC